MSLVLEPGTSKISGRTSIYFQSMSGRQVKNSVQVYLKMYFVFVLNFDMKVKFNINIKAVP